MEVALTAMSARALPPQPLECDDTECIEPATHAVATAAYPQSTLQRVAVTFACANHLAKLERGEQTARTQDLFPGSA